MSRCDSTSRAEGALPVFSGAVPNLALEGPTGFIHAPLGARAVEGSPPP